MRRMLLAVLTLSVCAATALTGCTTNRYITKPTRVIIQDHTKTVTPPAPTTQAKKTPPKTKTWVLVRNAAMVTHCSVRLHFCADFPSDQFMLPQASSIYRFHDGTFHNHKVLTHNFDQYLAWTTDHAGHPIYCTAGPRCPNAPHADHYTVFVFRPHDMSLPLVDYGNDCPGTKQWPYLGRPHSINLSGVIGMELRCHVGTYTGIRDVIVLRHNGLIYELIAEDFLRSPFHAGQFIASFRFTS